VLQDAPVDGEQGEPAFALEEHGMAKRVAGAGIEVNLLAAGWLLARDEDADPGAVVPRVGRGGAGQLRRPGRGGQGMAAGRAGVLPAGVSPLAATVAVAGYCRPSLGLPLAGLIAWPSAGFWRWCGGLFGRGGGYEDVLGGGAGGAGG